jgi:hypothetical protein
MHARLDEPPAPAAPPLPLPQPEATTTEITAAIAVRTIRCSFCLGIRAVPGIGRAEHCRTRAAIASSSAVANPSFHLESPSAAVAAAKRRDRCLDAL